jgi:DNA-binding MarR family transcriptional regulator
LAASLSRRRGGVPRRFRLEDHLFFYFSQILARRTRAINRDLAEFALDYSRWRVMAVLHDQGSCSMGRLAELSSVDRTTLTRTVGQMESKELVSRETGAGDRRRVSLSLTSHGADVFGRILPVVLARTDRALLGFTLAEAQALQNQMRRMADNLKE